MIDILKKIISEEIGRNFKSHEHLDFFPYVDEKYSASIRPDKNGHDVWATFKIKGGKTTSKKFPSDEEAIMWIRDISRKLSVLDPKETEKYEVNPQKRNARIK